MGAYQLVDLQGFGLSSGDPYSYSYEAKIVDCTSTGTTSLTDYEGYLRTHTFGAHRMIWTHLVDSNSSSQFAAQVGGSFATWQAMSLSIEPSTTSTGVDKWYMNIAGDTANQTKTETEHFGESGYGGLYGFQANSMAALSAEAKFRNFRVMKGRKLTVNLTGNSSASVFKARLARDVGEFPALTGDTVAFSGSVASLVVGQTHNLPRFPVHRIEFADNSVGFNKIGEYEVSTGIWGGSEFNVSTSTASTWGHTVSVVTQGLVYRDQFPGVALGAGWSYSGSPDVSGGVLSLGEGEWAAYTGTNALGEILVQCETYYEDKDAARPGILARAQGAGAAVDCRSAVYLDYLDANSSLISTTTSSGVTGISYQKLCVPSTIPANARYAKFYPVKTGTGDCQAFVRNVFANYGPTCCATPGLGTPLPGVPSQSSGLTGAQLVVGTAGACTSTSPGMDVTVSWQYSTALSTAASKLVGITFFEEKDPAGTPGSYFPVHSTGGLSLNANSTLTGNGLHTVHFGVGSNDVSTGGRGTGSTDDQSRKWYAFVQVTQFGITLGNVTSNVFQSPSSYGFCT